MEHFRPSAKGRSMMTDIPNDEMSMAFAGIGGALSTLNTARR
jgi:hypothetical protein